MQNAAANEETVEIPEEALVACPLKDYALLPVSKCVDCPKFGGLEDRFPGGPHPFAVRYLHKCWGAPVRRTMQVMAKG